jgi:hypothetical protein
MTKILHSLIFIFFLQFVGAQPTTVGLLYHDVNVSDGYILYTPLSNNEVFLINNCGESVNHWTFTELPGATCYLLNNGNLLRAGKDNLEIRDWDNNVVWTYSTTANNILQHHDIEPLPNGNIICIVTDRYPIAEMTLQGRNPANTAASFKLEKIVELQPIGTNDAAIVWEWKFKDHLIQDFDATKLNYGIVENHPELLDINYNNLQNNDYIHLNGIDYNASLDQIIISSRNLSEIFIIDHSTTTTQAASHIGGNSNKGGDFLWRWGNPSVYKQGTDVDRKLFSQHNPEWVENGYLDEGKITVFNNGDVNSSQTFTSVVLLNPEINNGEYTISNGKFLPQDYDWSWNGTILGTTLNEDKQSGTHCLPNGNIIISETSTGRVSEITKTGTLLWSYRNPASSIVNSNPVYYPQFTSVFGSNSFFKAEKYPSNFAGFTGHDMNPTGILEDQNALSATCNTLGNTAFSLTQFTIKNPINKKIEFNATLIADAILIYDANGRNVISLTSFNGNEIDINLPSGLYFMKIQKENTIQNLKLLVSN